MITIERLSLMWLWWILSKAPVTNEFRTNYVHVDELNALDNLYNVSCKHFPHSTVQFNTIYIILKLKMNY